MSELNKLLEIITEVKNEMEKIDPSIKERLDYLNESLSESGDIIARREEFDGFMPSKTMLQETAGAKERERIIRMPNVIPTEISVGQRPGSEDRQQFELWMSNLAMDNNPEVSAVQNKIGAITNFFENPAANLAGASIPETLSYLMFLNQFTWMIQEFNASVAGFLWEPFLAALFGGKSQQVPAGKGDIADIRIYTKGSPNNPISLKILNETGDVKGSFRDMVNYFANDTTGKPMRYVVGVKSQSKKKKQVSAVTFYEFDISGETFFEYMGGVAYAEKATTREQTFKPKNKYSWLQRTSAGNLKIKHARTGKDRKLKKAEWVFLAKAVKDEEGNKVLLVIPEVAEELNLRLSSGEPVLEGFLDPALVYTIDRAEFLGGGAGGARAAKTYEEMPGLAGHETKHIWGGMEEYKAWSTLANEMKEASGGRAPYQEFFQIVAGMKTHEDVPYTYKSKKKAADDREMLSGAKGYVTNQQFHIKPAHYSSMGINLGRIAVTTDSVEKFFEESAKKLNEDLVLMFNKLADLTDNVGRFFLANCGEGRACTEKDMANRNTAGQSAIGDAKELEDAVERSVTKTLEGK